jgi:hypothetical protein
MNGWQIFVEVAGRPPYEVRPGESIVGRSRMAQVHINESTVSRQHARILTSPLGEVTIEDLGSSNGTYVNNEKIEGRRKLADGDRVHVGDAELRLRIVAPVAPSEATVRMSLPPMTAPMGGRRRRRHRSAGRSIRRWRRRLRLRRRSRPSRRRCRSTRRCLRRRRRARSIRRCTARRRRSPRRRRPQRPRRAPPRRRLRRPPPRRRSCRRVVRRRCGRPSCRP